MGSLQQNTIKKTEDTAMAVVFPQIDMEQFRWRKAAADEKELDSELEKYLIKPNMNRIAIQETKKIHVEWPTILSSDCSTWLSTRKAESDKKQSEKEKTDDNPWLVKGGAMSAVDLASTVRVGLLRAGTVQVGTSEEKMEDKVESRIPLPMTEEVFVPKKTEEEEKQTSLSAQVKMGLMRAGSISIQPEVGTPSVENKPKPWAPKSLAEQVRIGLLKAGGQVKDEASDVQVTVEETLEEEVEGESWAPKSLADEVRIGLLKAGGQVKDEDSDTQASAEETLEQEVEKESTPDHQESLAETLKKSLMNIKVEQPLSPLKTSIADNLRKSLLDISSSDAEESKSESLDNWIMDDNQSEASIVTLDTITDSLDMEDFDDFEDMEHELSMWITKA